MNEKRDVVMMTNYSDAVNEVVNMMRKNYAEFTMRSEYNKFDTFEDAYADTEDMYTVEEGRTYTKIVKDLRNGQRSVAGFIVRKETKKFKVGDMLMAASWNAPATNKSRGNIFTAMPTSIYWTGIQ